jgi:hypothetical protein
MADDGQYLDVTGLVILPAGGLRETGNPWMPFELADADGSVVAQVAAYLKDVQACGRSEATLRSYAHLCRSRHKNAYADAQVMPRRPWGFGVCRGVRAV